MTGRLARTARSTRALAVALTLLATTVLAAGCVGLPEGSGVLPVAGDQLDETATPRTLWLTAEPGSADAGGGLTGAEPTGATPGEVPSGNFFTRWGSPSAYAQFTGAPLQESLLVTGDVTITAFARADGPAVQAGVFPHFIAYFGSDVALNADGSADAEPVLLPGNVVRFDVTLNLPPNGLVLEEGLRPRVLLVAVMTQDERAGDVTFLVNATDTPAHVAFTAAPVALPFTGPLPTEPAVNEGSLSGSAYAGGPREGASQATHPLGPGPGTLRVDLGLEVGDAAGFGDVDLAVFTEDGDFIARSVTPFGVEAIRLYPGVHYPLDAGSWFHVKVTNYGSGAATYELSVAWVGESWFDDAGGGRSDGDSADAPARALS